MEARGLLEQAGAVRGGSEGSTGAGRRSAGRKEGSTGAGGRRCGAEVLEQAVAVRVGSKVLLEQASVVFDGRSGSRQELEFYSAPRGAICWTHY